MTSDSDEFLAVACEAVRRSGDDALDALGWWDLLDQLDDPDARAAAFVLFRAQGRELVTTPALGGLLAHPYLDAPRPGAVGAAIGRFSARRGWVETLLGAPPAEQILLGRPGEGARLVEVDRVELRPVDIPGRMALTEVSVRATAPIEEIPESVAAPARSRSSALGRLALAFEMLGAAEEVLRLAVDYASAREQFGKPIGSFQAIRHLLAWARTECAVVEAVLDQAVRLGPAAPPRFDAIAKALAGRNAKRVCDRTLQCFGGIGFTAEHDHHHFHSRVLALDALLGSSAALSAELGAALRSSGTDPRIPHSLLLTGWTT